MAKSVFGVVRNKRLVFRQELRLRNEPDVFPVAGDDGHVEITGSFELLQHYGGGVIIVDELFGLNHQIFDMDSVVQFLFENGFTMVIHHQ